MSLGTAVVLYANSILNTGSAALTVGSTVDGGYTLTLNSTAATTFSGIVGGSTKLTGIITNSGGTVVFNTTAISTDGDQTYNDAATLGGNITFTTTGDNIVFASTLNSDSTTRTLDIVAGAGNTTFTGAVGGSEPLGNTTIGTAVLTAAAIEAQGTLAITNSGTSEIDGVISDGASALALTKAGAGSLTLSGTNTYTGTSTISAGSIIIGADAGLGAAPGSASAGHFVFASGGSGTLNTTASFTLHANRGIALTGNGIINTNASRTLTYAGVIAGSGTLTKAGAGTLTLSGTNTHSGSNIISAGTLSVAGDRAFGAVPGSTDADNIIFSSGGSGILNASGNFTLNTKRGITLSGNGIIDVNASRTLTYGGVIAGTSGTLTKLGTGTLILSGANTYTTGTIISKGTLQLGAANVLANAAFVSIANDSTAAVSYTHLTLPTNREV